jgi:hypothetical protein
MITLNFDEVLKRIYNAQKGVEVRYGLGQGFEYCKQFADEAQGHATNAKASADKAEQTVAGIEQTKTDAVQEVQNAQTTATTAITQTKDAALTDIGNAKTGALQEVANSTATAETAASAAAGSASDANASKEAAATSAAAAADSASAASTSETNSSASESAAQKSAEEAAASAALAGTRAGTDKTLKVEDAPADAAATGAALDKKANKDVILDEDGNAIFYSKAEVEAKIKEILAAQREEDLARIKFWASDDPTSPASFIGGTWERVENCTIWGASDAHPAGTTVEAGLPNITGQLSVRALKSIYGTGVFLTQENGALKSIAVDSIEYFSNLIATEDAPNAYGGSLAIDASGSNPIYGTSTTVQPPAYCLYIWRRVA